MQEWRKIWQHKRGMVDEIVTSALPRSHQNESCFKYDVNDFKSDNFLKIGQGTYGLEWSTQIPDFRFQIPDLPN